MNIKNSTRELDDVEFEKALPLLAMQLSEIDYRPSYSNDVLIRDWDKLCRDNIDGKSIASRSRIGMKLCEHFFPNFYDVQDRRGRSFSSMWQDLDLLKKILKWNRSAHSTPYLSELKRGIYFCGGLSKVTQYRPQLARVVSADFPIVFDPCAGWGGRLLGVTSNDHTYIGFEPNSQTYDGLMSLVEFLGISDRVSLHNDSALNMSAYDIGKVDAILTSPPYYDLEVYSNESSQSISNCDSYDDWVSSFLKPLIIQSLSYLKDEGVSFWNVSNLSKKMPLLDDVIQIHNDAGYEFSDIYSVDSCIRPGTFRSRVLSSDHLKDKSKDVTMKFTKED